MSAGPILALDPRVVAVFLEAAQVLKPPPQATVSEWAERKRMLSSESSSYVGLYSSAIAPYQVGMMDAVNLAGVEECVFFTSAQIGKSLCLENIFGYFVDEDPCPMIYMWPTLDVAKGWSAETLTPLLRDTPALAEKVVEGARKTGAAALFKSFPGGWLAVIGAASPAGLRRRRARVIFCEEIDDANYAKAGEEGDPIELVWARAKTFWNKLRILASTCTVKGESRIEARYEASNKQKYHVPCPQCGEYQVLNWENLVYPKNGEELNEQTVVYACTVCGAVIHEWEKPEMLRLGRWVAERPEITHIQGFWLNELYSPFVKWHEMARAWLSALAALNAGDTQKMRTFLNTSLARTWEEKEVEIDRAGLVKRCEDYTPDRPLPDGIILLTAGVDVQPDRLLCQVRGWGKGCESWSVDYRQFEGDTSVLVSTGPMPSPWQQLDAFLQREYVHARGVKMEIVASFLDSGFHTNEVYSFSKGIELSRRVFAAKGMSQFDHPPLKPFNRNNRAHVRMYPVGSSQIKRSIYQWLKIETPGPGYMHFTHHHCSAEYFDELTCEKLKKKYDRGFPVRFWEKPAGARNEVLDCNVYAYAALLSLSENVPKMLERLRSDQMEQARQIAEERRRNGDPNQMELPVVAELKMAVAATESATEPAAVAAGVSAFPESPASEPQSEENAISARPRTPRYRSTSSWV